MHNTPKQYRCPVSLFLPIYVILLLCHTSRCFLSRARISSSSSSSFSFARGRAFTTFHVFPLLARDSGRFSNNWRVRRVLNASVSGCRGVYVCNVFDIFSFHGRLSSTSYLFRQIDSKNLLNNSKWFSNVFYGFKKRRCRIKEFTMDSFLLLKLKSYLIMIKWIPRTETSPTPQ